MKLLTDVEGGDFHSRNLGDACLGRCVFMHAQMFAWCDGVLGRDDEVKIYRRGIKYAERS